MPWPKCTLYVSTLKKTKATIQNKLKQKEFLHALYRTDTMEKDERFHATVIAKMTDFIDMSSQTKSFRS